MRQHAPVYWDDACKVWGAARHEGIMAVSRDPAAFCSRMSSRPDSPALSSMLNLDDPEHERRRAICRELIAKVAPRGECGLVREIAAPLPMIVIGDMLGIAPEDRDRLLRWSDDNPTDDPISVIVDGERLSDEEPFHESLLILVGGDETNWQVITGAMRALCEHPAERAKLVGHPERIPTAVEEPLRWVTLIVEVNRTATRDVELRGQKMRERDKVLLLYKSGNRDESVFREPERLDVSRDPNDHVAGIEYVPVRFTPRRA